MTARKISCAVVGLGRAGWLMHVEGLLAHGGYEIVAVADPDPDRRKQALDRLGCATYSDIDELIAGTDCELIVVATPTITHYDDTRKVLAAGAHCVLEKPIARSHDEAQALGRMAVEQGKLIFAHHQQCFGAEYRHLREVIESGVIGPIFHIQVCWSHYNRRWDWQTLRRNGGGLLANACPHVLSIVLPLLGESVVSAYASLRNVKDAGDAEDYVNLCLSTGGGPTAALMVTSAGALPGTRWMLLGKYGSLSSDGTTSRLRYYDPARAESISVLDGAARDRKYIFEELPWQEEVRNVEPTVAGPTFYDNVYDVLRREAAMEVSFARAMEVMRVIDLARDGANQPSASQLQFA